MANNRLKVAIESLTTCAGCENAFLDACPLILDLLDGDVEIVYAPIIMDSPPPEMVDVVLITGAVRTEEDLKKLSEWRVKSRILVAFGTCSCFGGLPGLADLFDLSELLEYSYLKQLGTVNVEGLLPRNGVPSLLDDLKSVEDYVKVDLFLPGCPPPIPLIVDLVKCLVEGKAFSLSKKSVCDECPLNSGGEKVISSIRRWGFDEVDVGKCFLEQGFICLGPSTRGGCEARCIRVGYPCRGCMGPTEKCEDQAAKMISVLASASSIEDVSIEDLMRLHDLVGVMYRFTLPVSVLRRRMKGE